MAVNGLFETFEELKMVFNCSRNVNELRQFLNCLSAGLAAHSMKNDISSFRQPFCGSGQRLDGKAIKAKEGDISSGSSSSGRPR